MSGQPVVRRRPAVDPTLGVAEPLQREVRVDPVVRLDQLAGSRLAKHRVR